MAKEIEFRISPDGNLSFETFGIEGNEACDKVKNDVLQTLAVGMDLGDDEDSKKPEYWSNGPAVFTKA